MSRRSWIALLAIATAVLAVRVLVARIFPNVAWPDEIFQTSEQAHRLAFDDGLVPWEFREGARSWLLPGALAIIYRSAGSSYLLVGTIALALGSLIPVVGVFRVVARRGALLPAVVAAIVVGSWFELVYFGPKALNEVVAGHLLCGAVILLARELPPSTRRIAVAGVLAALAIALRIHLAPCGLVLAGLAWRRGKLAPFALGTIAIVIIAGAVDWVTWGSPFASYLTTIRFNLIEGRAQLFGVAPWWMYFATLAKVWHVAALAVIALAALGSRRDPWPLVLASVILVSHAAIGHKEYRFIAPALVLVIYSCGLGAADLVPRVRWPVAILATVAWCGISLGLALRVDTATTTIGNALTPPGWQFANQRDGLRIMRRVGALEPLCGVGLVEVAWYLTGGYTWLDRHVPMETISSPKALHDETPALDVVVAPARIGIPPPYVKLDCAGELCAWQRPGSCVRPRRDLRDDLGDPSPSSVKM